MLQEILEDQFRDSSLLTQESLFIKTDFTNLALLWPAILNGYFRNISQFQLVLCLEKSTLNLLIPDPKFNKYLTLIFPFWDTRTLSGYSGLPFSLGEMFQDSQWAPETTSSAELYVHYTCTYIPVIKFKL